MSLLHATPAVFLSWVSYSLGISNILASPLQRRLIGFINGFLGLAYKEAGPTVCCIALVAFWKLGAQLCGPITLASFMVAKPAQLWILF